MTDDHGMERYEKTEIYRCRYLERKEASDKANRRVEALRHDLSIACDEAEAAGAEARAAYKALIEYMGLPDGSMRA